MATWGKPAWNRLKSYGLPGSYGRHADSIGRIDPYPFDPYTGSEWKLVPGPADSSGVSFQSVSAPTRYLRHSSYQLRPDVDDGTTRFAQDATFRRTAGLADSSWSSTRRGRRSARTPPGPPHPASRPRAAHRVEFPASPPWRAAPPPFFVGVAVETENVCVNNMLRDLLTAPRLLVIVGAVAVL